MPYYFASTSQQNTNATANTDTLLHNWKTTAAGQRAAIQKIQAGSYTGPADNAVRLRLHRVATNSLTGGGAFTPNPLNADSPAALITSTTLPTIGTGTLNTVPPIQLAFNQRGTAIWAALNPDEACGIVGNAAANAEVVLDSQSTGSAVPINYDVKHSE